MICNLTILVKIVPATPCSTWKPKCIQRIQWVVIFLELHERFLNLTNAIAHFETGFTPFKFSLIIAGNILLFDFLFLIFRVILLRCFTHGKVSRHIKDAFMSKYKFTEFVITTFRDVFLPQCLLKRTAEPCIVKIRGLDPLGYASFCLSRFFTCIICIKSIAILLNKSSRLSINHFRFRIKHITDDLHKRIIYELKINPELLKNSSWRLHSAVASARGVLKKECFN